MRSRRSPVVIVVALALMVAAGAVAIAAVTQGGGVGPQTRRLGNGRVLQPQGTLVGLGNFPTGAAATPDGRFYWTVSTGRGPNDVRIVSVASKRVVQVITIPGSSGGIVMDPRARRAYVSGVPESDHADEKTPGRPGRGGDVVHVFSYAKGSGRAKETGTIPVPPPPESPVPQSFPPLKADARKLAWPDRLAISRDGRTLLVPLNLGDAAAIVDVASRRVRTVDTGHYPYGAAILPDGKTGLVSNETPGTVSVIDLDRAVKVKDIQVGAQLSHPEAIALDPSGRRAYVAIANSDQVAVIDTRALRVERTLSVGRREGLGVSPVALSVTPDARSLLVAEAGADELAVFRLPVASKAKALTGEARGRAVLLAEARKAAARDAGASTAEAGDAGEAEVAAPLARPAAKAFSLIGRIPVSDYPTDVEVTKAGTLLWTSGKGVGVGPNPKGPNPLKPDTDDNQTSLQYLPLIIRGQAGILKLPGDAAIRRLTPVASRAIRPDNNRPAPKGTPLRSGGPIKHVFYIVRENRTYDQVLGDVKRGDGDPKLTLFGQRITPNLHALVQRFPLLDQVFANSEASIDGHFWASAAKVSDYVNKNWFQNYAGRQRPYDFGTYEVTWPSKGFLFDQAERQHIPYFNYGEAVAGVVPLFPDKDRTPAAFAEVERKFKKSDLGNPVGCFPNDAYIGTNSISGNPIIDSSVPPGAPPKIESRFDCFKQRFTQQLSDGAVPAFNYLTLTDDHTNGATPGQRTPRAMVASNDYALGQIVDLISKSSIWSSSAIFVIEDDSQDGADHVDAHRIPAAVLSPYAKRGARVSTRYDFLSVIRSMELILGMKPLGLFDRLATPMYDAFDSTPRNSAPFSAVAPTWPLLERNSPTVANARLSRSLNLRTPDQVPQRVLDRILWQSVKGRASEPPPPGPNAVAGG